MPRKQTTIEDLARMIKKGFDGNDKRFDRIETRLDRLEQGHEDIQLRLGNVPFKFEVEDLKKRVKKIELKVGVRRS